MAQPVTLAKARKSAAQQAARHVADANAEKFGRTRAEKLAEAAAKTRQAKIFDGHKRP